MQVLLTRVSDSEHRFEIERADGSSESAVLNTRSFLVHDLVHFAVESELQETQAFYGLLAAGRPLAEINDRENPPSEPALMRIEALVGPLQSLCQGRGDRGAILAYFQQVNTPVEAAFVDAVLERMRQLLGHWRGTPFPESMRLEWRVPLPPPR
jgi:hypothetical protein